MLRDYKGALRTIAIIALLGGGYSIAMIIPKLQGWTSVTLTGLSIGAMVYASTLLIEEGRARERADRERRAHLERDR
jgi:hypothetical protein